MIGTAPREVPPAGAPEPPEDRPNQFGAKGRLVWLAVLSIALVLSRWMLAPRYLVTFDAINFALSVSDFNPALHQPQPPGYPLFVALLKLIASLIPKIESVFLVAALMVSMVSLVLLWLLGDRMAGRGCGLAAALLLLFNPAFWLSALTNPVRLCFAAGAIGVALCLWRAYEQRSLRWFFIAAAACGVAAGFRPELAVVLLPLVAWTALQLRSSWKAAAVSLLCFLAAVATWLPVLVSVMGGWRQFLNILNGYSHQEVGPTSILYGASIPDSLDMIWKAIVWSSLGVLSWIWIVPAALRQRFSLAPVTKRFLLIWFLPGLLFYALFHVGDPDHTLSIVPVTCLAGASILTAVMKRASRSTQTLVLLSAVLLNVGLFFKPISKTSKPSTYRPVQWVDRYITDVIEGARSARQTGAGAVVFYAPSTGWRQLSYYDPNARIFVADTVGGAATVREIRGKHAETVTSPDGFVHLPACGVIAWVDPTEHPMPHSRAVVQQVNSRVSLTRGHTGETFDFRSLKFVADGESCGTDSR